MGGWGFGPSQPSHNDQKWSPKMYPEKMNACLAPATNQLQPSEINQLLNTINEQISRAESKVSALTHKIMPILSDGPQEPSSALGKVEHSAVSPLGRDMKDVIRRIDALNESLNDLLDRTAI